MELLRVISLVCTRGGWLQALEMWVSAGCYERYLAVFDVTKQRRTGMDFNVVQS